MPLPIEEEPKESNFPPFYDSASVSPEFGQLVHFTIDPERPDEKIRFVIQSLGYGDFNLDDRIFWQWYVDYDPGNPQVKALGPDLGREPNGTAERLDDISFGAEPQVCLDSTRVNGFMRVMVIVADRPFLRDDTNTRVIEGGKTFRIVWFVECS